MYLGDMRGRGSATIKVPHIGLMAYDLPQAVADGSAIAATGLTDASSTLTIAGFSKKYTVSDLAKFTDATDILNPATFAADAVASFAMRTTNLIANVTDDFTNYVGSTGVDMTFANLVSGINLLELNSSMPIAAGDALALLHPVQIGDLRTAMLTIGGAVQWTAPAAELLNIRGTGFQGQFFGLDIFSSPQVPTANAGADRAGAIFLRGGVLWMDMSVQAENNIDQLVLDGGKVLFERDRSASGRLTDRVSSGYRAVSKGIDLLGVSVITDA